MTAITVLHRFRCALPARYLLLLEPTDELLRIRGAPYRRFTWRGVPGRLCDVITAEGAFKHRADDAVIIEIANQRAHKLSPALDDIVLELGERAGKFDGAVRRRYAIRLVTDRTQLAIIPRADVRVLVEDDALTFIVRPEKGAPIVDHFQRLRSDLDGYDMVRVIMWHRNRYYRHISYADAEAYAKQWASEVAATGLAASWTLAEANRAASRRLYHLSRELGWRKLTLREREALGMSADSAQWHRADECGSGIISEGNDEGEPPEWMEAAEALQQLAEREK